MINDYVLLRRLAQVVGRELALLKSATGDETKGKIIAYTDVREKINVLLASAEKPSRTKTKGILRS